MNDACLNLIRPEQNTRQVVPVLGDSAGEGAIGQDGMGDSGNMGQDVEEGVRKPKPDSRPDTHAKQEIREHEVTQLPF